MKKILFVFCILGMILNNLNANESKLTATIIGSGSPMYNENRAGASVLIRQGDTSILVDMGNGTQANLRKIKFNKRKLSALFFTHHHLDHNEEFIPLFISSLLGRNDFIVVGPPNTTKHTEVYLDLYKEDIMYRLGKSNRSFEDKKDSFEARDFKGGEVFFLNGIKISTLKVPHTIYTIAYKFEYNNQSIVITGDLTYTKELSSFAKNSDFMIIDSGGMIMENNKRKQKGPNKDSKRKGKNNSKERAHLNLYDSSKIASDADVKNLVYTHFVSGKINKEDSLNKINKNYKGNIIFAKDLLVL